MPWTWIAGNSPVKREAMIIEAEGAFTAGTLRAVTSTRKGGFSAGPWSSFNLGTHTGDDRRAVMRNRELLRAMLELPAEPQWLRQVHGRVVVEARSDGVVREGDAAYTDCPGIVCAVLTADCLPVVIGNREGTETAVAHCGWRGLADGVLGATLARFRSPPADLEAWLGPAISSTAFEVGSEVKAAYLQAPFARLARGATEAAFRPAGDGKYHADLYALARLALAAHGVRRISGGGRCTLGEAETFFSYRREGRTGRMATLTWILPKAST
jgi:YfiH family protein